MFAVLESALAKVWHEIDGETRAEAQQAIAGLKADYQSAKDSLSQFGPLVSQFKADAEQVIATVAPEVKAQFQALVAKLEADAKGLAGDVTGPQPAPSPEPPAAA